MEMTCKANSTDLFSHTLSSLHAVLKFCHFPFRPGVTASKLDFACMCLPDPQGHARYTSGSQMSSFWSNTSHTWLLITGLVQT